MYDFRISFNEEEESKQCVEQIIKVCEHMRGELAMEFVKGYVQALQDFEDKFPRGFTHTQILYISYLLYKWLAETK